MNPSLTAAIVAACLLGAVMLGIQLRRLVPVHHLTAESKDAVKLAMGLVATMSALLLGLLLNSARIGYDGERTQVIQMAAKIAFLDRVLTLYGPDSEGARVQLHAAIDEAVRQIWPKESRAAAVLAPNVRVGDAVYAAIQRLSPRDDVQRGLKTEAVGLALQLGELRALLAAQSVGSISTSMLLVIDCWFVSIFLSFSLLAPPNATTTLALIVSACSVAGAFFLILELDEPFGGLIRISNTPMVNALSQFTQ